MSVCLFYREEPPARPLGSPKTIWANAHTRTVIAPNLEPNISNLNLDPRSSHRQPADLVIR